MEGRPALVTGATGFVGGALARRLLEAGSPVRAAARRPDAAAALAAAGAEVVTLDLTAPAAFGEAVAGVDVVFHVAAWVGFGDDREAEAINAVAPQALLRAAAAAGARRFVHFSTNGVLGVPADPRITGSTPVDTDQRDAYHRTKAQGEVAVRAAAAETGLELVVLRPGMVYGPGSRGWTAGMAKLVRRGTPVVFGQGDGHAFPVYVDNLVDAALLAGSVPEAAGHTFHIVDETVTWARWFDRFGAMVGRAPRRLPLWVARGLARANAWLPLGLPIDRDKLGMMRTRWAFDPTPEREILGWTPAIDLDEGMRRAEAWLRETGRLS